MSEPAKPPLASRAFDLATEVAGFAIAVVAVVSALVLPWDPAHLWALLVGGLLIVVMSRFPLVLASGPTGIEVGFESCILVFLACTQPVAVTLAVWSIGQITSMVTRPKRWAVRLFNSGLGPLSGAAAVLAMISIDDLRATGPRELGAVAVGCAVYFTVDFLISGVSVALEDRTPVLDAIRQARALVALGLFVAIDTLGYLAVAVARGLPAWASALLIVPMATILVATRALSRGAENRRRLGALFEAASATHGITDPIQLLEALREHARKVVASGETTLRASPPGSGEVGARMSMGQDALWLVAPARDRARSSADADRRALTALATMGEEAFARLSLVEEMGWLARHDALTGLPNRLLFLSRVAQAVDQAREAGTGVAVLFLDLDGFKAINDRFGHDIGDELLVAVARRLSAELRETDTVARLGGDEFAILLEGLRRDGRVKHVCERILAALARDFSIASHDVVVGTSIGIVIADDRDDAGSLLRNADMAMYRAKAEGKGRWAVYQPTLREESLRRLELVERLRQGVPGELVVHYQPVLDLRTGEIDGLEALVRWKRGGELIPPDEFIAVAEESGLIHELGRFVLGSVVRDAPLLQAAAGCPLSLAVNVSSVQLRGPGLADLIAQSCSAIGECTLVVELTESVLIGRDLDTARTLTRLRVAGARLALDDFGTGFSSIGYLQHLPVDILKIDRTFTRDVDSDPRAAALVNGMLLMGQALGVVAVAEGVERTSQVRALRDIGCHLGQGFLFARPMPLAEMQAALRDRRASVRVLGDDPAHSGDRSTGEGGSDATKHGTGSGLEPAAAS